jgi:uncharacterized RDD family membrane protein YckC
MDESNVEYAGFWIRFGAALIDSLIVVVITYPMLISIYGWAYLNSFEKPLIAGPADFLISWVLPAIGIIWLCMRFKGTPGKMALKLEIIDANTGNAMTLGQSIGRYFGYYVSIIPFLLGLIWVGIDPKKQGWHDKLANTVVIKKKS